MEYFYYVWRGNNFYTICIADSPLPFTAESGIGVNNKVKLDTLEGVISGRKSYLITPISDVYKTRQNFMEEAVGSTIGDWIRKKRDDKFTELGI